MEVNKGLKSHFPEMKSGGQFFFPFSFPLSSILVTTITGFQIAQPPSPMMQLEHSFIYIQQIVLLIIVL